MVRINKRKLSSKQVNAIILLVRKSKGKVYHSAKREDRLELDLSLLCLAEKIKLFLQVQKIKREKSPT